MALRRINKVQRRKLSIFLRCIIISFLAWTLFAISSDYTFTKKASMSYVNLPENKAFHPLQSDTVSVRIRMSGWKVFMERLHPDTAKIQVDLSGLKSRNFIVFGNQIGFINRQFPTDKQVIAVSPDTLYFDFSKQTQRKVPVKAVESLTFQRQYGVIGETRTNPEYVTITGPLEDVASIEYLETDTIKGKDVNTDVRTVAYLNKQQRTNITIYPTFAEVIVPVGEITEKVIELPIKVENSKGYTSVRVLPSKVRATILLAVKDYNKYTSRDFEAVVDLDAWKDHKVSSLPVIITKMPDYVKVLSIEPQNVDFFVRR
ncbi:hypothetical protein SMI01S_16790 [Sphingobacterium mizutaii NBRC 14946 = DSM 11724]|uniref:Uncharacterized protein conserved in bacteria n=3 Tax=Sphingobacteriaceae TaxID=84566 RepID=A0AAJ4XDE5_9SPHI|nr:hypothetical protein SMI01S_16790 [Sphingobacterium mizutaii NBRC 14946 = DSM 11724]SDL26990.1 hypothetical protein SAMN05192578_102182 [Sphingobacterium mizutaii]SNV53469.1 Uncharacterized protein conserved in bacteria [Sphingobacterium mizutaii]